MGEVENPHQALFLSTPSARRATGPGLDPGPGRMISIHALREEGDSVIVGGNQLPHISIHALREEGDRPSDTSFFTMKQFLSTPSARRATYWKAMKNLAS